MSDRAALLAAIRANPRDEALRLVYADWLEEFGGEEDQKLAEFIRLQCRFEPFRDVYHDEEANALAEQEAAYSADQHRWLGSPLNDTKWEHFEDFGYEFRRGMLERLFLPLDAFLEWAEALVERHPAFHRLDVIKFRGRGGALAECRHLSAMRELTLADGFDEADARALAGSPHLRGLEVLRVWVWNPAEAEPARHLAGLPAVGEIELVQLVGGREEGDNAEQLDEEMDRLAGQFDDRDAIVRVVRPFAKKFPLDGDVWRDLYAGHVRDGRPTLVLAGRPTRLLFFDDDGRLVDEEECDLDSTLARPLVDKEEIVERLHRRYGFELGLIHVREISLEDLWIGLPYPEEPRDVLYWHEGGNFEINYGGGDSWWAGPDGKVHST